MFPVLISWAYDYDEWIKFCLNQDGQRQSHLNISLIVRDKDTKTMSTDHNLFEERGETKTESNQCPSAYKPIALLLGQTGSLLVSVDLWDSFNSQSGRAPRILFPIAVLFSFIPDCRCHCQRTVIRGFRLGASELNDHTTARAQSQGHHAIDHQEEGSVERGLVQWSPLKGRETHSEHCFAAASSELCQI